MIFKFFSIRLQGEIYFHKITEKNKKRFFTRIFVRIFLTKSQNHKITKSQPHKITEKNKKRPKKLKKKILFLNFILYYMLKVY
jgi:hypothetical protein